MNEENSKLERQKETFKALFDNSSDGAMLIKNSKIYDCNISVVKMFKFRSKEECNGKTLAELSATYQQYGGRRSIGLEYYINKCIKDGFVNFEWLCKRDNGEKFEAEITLTKIIVDDNEILHTVIKDISEKRRLRREALKKDAIMIQQSRQAAMGEMIGNIAHQWRQPLSALGLVVQKIKFYYDEDLLTENLLDKSVKKSNMLIEKMSTTIDDFRNFFKTDRIKEKFFIKDSIDETFELIDASLRQHNIGIKTSYSQKDIDYFGYKNELEQVLLNIINNAKDILLSNDTKNPIIKIEVLQRDKEIFIEISDNGGGVPKNIIKKIFDPYFTTKEQGKGTGIGLYMSKMIIETNMNGVLGVRNSDIGAVFVIQIKE